LLMLLLLFFFWLVVLESSSSSLVNTLALIYVIDCNDYERLALSCNEMEKLLGEKELHGIPLLIFGKHLLHCLPQPRNLLF
jgi:hypothetical protein